jgi:hypothetical protein
MAFEPPRDSGSFLTAIRQASSSGAAQREYWRTSPAGVCTSMCEPAVKRGNARRPPIQVERADSVLDLL